MSRQITLVSVDCGSAHACELAHGLEKFGEVTKVWENENKHGLDYLNPDALFGYDKIPKSGDDLIFVAAITYDKLRNNPLNRLKKFDYKNIRIIISDGRYARNPDRYNKLFKGMDVIATGCKRHFREPLPVKTYYQPFDLSGIDQTKNERLTISHSPFVPVKFREKGTHKILDVIADLDVEFDLITGIKWDKCLQRKAKSHIFVDQIDHYDRAKFKFKSPDYVWPALGKSGIEAMHLGCLVITYGRGYNTDIPAPPVVWVTDNFKEVLEYYIYNPKERRELAEKGKEWALKYATPEFMAKTVLR